VRSERRKHGIGIATPGTTPDPGKRSVKLNPREVADGAQSIASTQVDADSRHAVVPDRSKSSVEGDAA
jgi:hypothetical protein